MLLEREILIKRQMRQECIQCTMCKHWAKESCVTGAGNFIFAFIVMINISMKTVIKLTKYLFFPFQLLYTNWNYVLYLIFFFSFPSVIKKSNQFRGIPNLVRWGRLAEWLDVFLRFLLKLLILFKFSHIGYSN